MKKNNKGFTLAELLIVVAIIAVLVAVAIPVFTNSLDKAKQAADEANIRAAYAEASSDYILEGAFDSSYVCGGITCTASASGSAITITVASGAGQQSDAYKNGVSYTDGVFTAQ